MGFVPKIPNVEEKLYKEIDRINIRRLIDALRR